jgi:hypothetical protein
MGSSVTDPDLYPDPNPDPGFDDQKLETITAEKMLSYFFDPKICTGTVS